MVARTKISAGMVSCVVHAIIVFVLVILSSHREPSSTSPHQAIAEVPARLVWLPSSGPGGGGGGGGNEQSAPIRRAELPGRDEISVPAQFRQQSDEIEKPQPPQAPTLSVPLQTLGASDLTAMGLLEAGVETLSQGPGRDGGAGPGRGPGIGAGNGPGLGDGDGGNTGGGPVGPGTGVTMPVALHREQPRYTVEAMRARIQGAVVIECVVEPTGLCAKARVVRSLDARLGLDQQALLAAAAWRFAPGTRFGKPVAVLVTIQLGFSIH